MEILATIPSSIFHFKWKKYLNKQLACDSIPSQQYFLRHLTTWYLLSLTLPAHKLVHQNTPSKIQHCFPKKCVLISSNTLMQRLWSLSQLMWTSTQQTYPSFPTTSYSNFLIFPCSTELGWISRTSAKKLCQYRPTSEHCVDLLWITVQQNWSQEKYQRSNECYWRKTFQKGLITKAKKFGWLGVAFFKATQMLMITSFPEQVTLIFKHQ